MSQTPWIAIALLLLTLGSVIAGVLRASPGRSRTRRVLGVILQLGSAGALYLLLCPPPLAIQHPALTVLTAGAQASSVSADNSQMVIALPEYPGDAQAESISTAVDLAAALRQRPAASALRVLGDGLDARDLDAAATYRVTYHAPSAKPGVVDLQLPTNAIAGSQWVVSGHVAGIAQGQVSVLDPAGASVGTAQIAEDGGFRIGALSPLAGPMIYRLSLADANAQQIDSLSLPISIEPAQSLRLLLLAAAPNPELKYLRRWAADAGLLSGSTVQLRPRLSLSAGAPELAAANLGELDLLVIDDRSWAGLPAAQKDQVKAAVEGGMGLLLRLSEEPDRNGSALWAGLGFKVEAAEISRDVQLAPVPGTAGTDQPQSAGKATPNPRLELQRRAVTAQAPLSVPLLRDADGSPLGLWRAQGQGRIGLWWLSDSYKLVLAGQGARHASLWSEIASQLRRPQAQATVQLIGAHHWVDQRLNWCGLAADAQIIDPQMRRSVLEIDPQMGSAHCAAFWPRLSGWHQLENAGERQSFYVRAADDAVALRAQTVIDANLSLPRPSSELTELAPTTQVPGPRWPWFALWLLLSGALWWAERRSATELG